MMQRWNGGHRIQLLENGDEFFPSVFSAIRAATSEIFIETFILADDKVGRQLRQELIVACNRGVEVFLTVDGFGSPDVVGEFADGLTAAGVKVLIFNPGSTVFGVRTNLLRRLHRKIVAIDKRIAYIGGINFIHDQMVEFGPLAKQDYAVEIEGPVALEIRDFALQAIDNPQRSWSHRTYSRFFHRRQRAARFDPRESGDNAANNAKVLFVTRDNYRQRTAIERYYRLAIRGAQRELIIANAYFFPGYRLLRGLRNAARRQVKVSLILQGHPDIPLVRWAAHLLYDYLLSANVRIYEYCERPLHAKVAVMDDSWSTVGSSNLDPLSLSLNLEANVVVQDEALNKVLRSQLLHLIEHGCKEIKLDSIPKRTMWRGVVSAMAFHLVRYFSAWAKWLPHHSITLKKLEVDAVNSESPSSK